MNDSKIIKYLTLSTMQQNQTQQMHQSPYREYWSSAGSWYWCSWYVDWWAWSKFSLERRVCTCMYLQGSGPIGNPKIQCGSSESSFPVPAPPQGLPQLPNQLPVNVWTLQKWKWAADDDPQVLGCCVSQDTRQHWCWKKTVEHGHFCQFDFLRT